MPAHAHYRHHPLPTYTRTGRLSTACGGCFACAAKGELQSCSNPRARAPLLTTAKAIEHRASLPFTKQSTTSHERRQRPAAQHHGVQVRQGLRYVLAVAGAAGQEGRLARGESVSATATKERGQALPGYAHRSEIAWRAVYVCVSGIGKACIQ
jgi:hypothetical protein